MYGQADGSIIIDTELDSQGFEAGSKELESAISSFEKTISKIGQSLNSLGPTFTRALQGSGSAISSFDSKIGKIDESLQKARDEIVNMENQLRSLGSAQIPTEEYTQLTNLIDTTGAKIDELVYKQKQLMASDSKDVISQYLELKDQIASTETQLEKLRALQSEMQSSPGDYGSADFDRVRQAIAEAEVNLETLNMEMRELESTGSASSKIAQYQSLQTQIEQLGATADTAVEKMAAMEQDGSAYTIGAKTAKYQQLEATLRDLKSEFARNASAASSMKSRLSGVGEQASSTERRVRKLSNTSRILRNTFKTVGRIGKTAFSTIASVASSAASSMRRLSNNSRSTNNQFSSLISSAKKFTLSLLGARGVYALLRKAVSQYMSENEELSDTLDACWSGIGNLLGPIITKLINLVATATSYVTSFLKLFNWFGSSTSSSLDNATESANDLKRALASFDDLNVLSYSSSSSDSDDDSSTTTLPEVSLPDWINSLAEKIKSGDWAGIGKLLGTKLNDAVQKINDYIRWDKVGDKITKGIKNLASLFNNFVSTVNWKLIGDTLAQGFNTIINTAYLILTEFDWNKLASGLGQTLQTFIATVDWRKLGLTLSTGFATIFTSLTSFINELDGKDITNAISNFIRGILDVDWVTTLGDFSKSISDFIMEMDFGDVASSLSDMFATALKGLNAAVENFDWSGLGAQIADFINNIDWVDLIGNLGELLGNLVKGIFEWATTLTDKTDFRQMAKDIFNGLKKALENIDWLDIAVLILKSIIQSLFVVPTEIAIGLAEGIYEAISDGFEQASKAAETWQSYVEPYIEEAGGNVAEGYYNAIVDGLEASWPYLKEHVVMPLAETFGVSESEVDEWASGIRTFFTDTVPGIWNNFKTWITETVPNWFKSIPEKVGGWFSDIGTKIKDWFTNLPDKISEWFDNLWQPIKDFDWSNLGYNIGQWFGNAVKDAIHFVTETIPEWFSGVWDSITTALSTFFTETLPNFFSSVWEGIKTFFTDTLPKFFTEWIPQAWENIKTFFSELPEKIWDAVQSGWNWLVDVGSSIIDGIWEGLQTVWTAITNFVDGFVQGFKDALGIHSPSTVFAEIGEYLVDGLLNGIQGVWDSITGFFSDAWDGITSFFGDTWENIKTGASKAWEGITTTLSGAWDGIKSTASTVWSNIKSGISTTWSNIKSGASTAWSGIKNTLSNSWNNIKSTASTTWSNLKTTIGNGWNNIKSGAATAWGNIKSSLSSTWENIKSTASSKFESVKSTIQNKGWSGLGSNIISGIQNGISAGWTWLSNTVSNLASGLLNTAKNVLGIHSPSKVFRDEVGLNIGYGIGEGIDDSESYVLKSVTGIADAIAEEAAVEIPPIQYAESSVVSGLDRVTDKLSNIAAVFQSITDMLTSIGGVKLPQIATGAIMPIANRAEAVSSPTGASGAIPAEFANNVDERFDDLADLLRQLIELVRSKNLNIDLKALTDMITKLQRDNSRNFGGAL